MCKRFRTQFQPSFISTKGNNLGILVTFTSLNIRNDEKIITKSKPIDINSELSAVSRKTYKNLPKPESVKLTHDVASEIERLRNIDFEPVTKPTVEPELNYKDGIHIKKPLSEPDLDLKSLVYGREVSSIGNYIFLLIIQVVLGLLIVVVPTKYAQNSVFALSCSYILMSGENSLDFTVSLLGVSYLNDFLVYNFTSNLRPLQFDMTQFFDSNVTLSTSHFLIVLGTLLVSSVTTFLNSNKYLK
uniref:Uncharacterized protein n=1 Tax=Theileria parva TaxID=5875 RepID=Q4N1Q8_THEPA|eukprot:XP_764307.1 hypothetical protein [Theileria parva strain Muguga]